MKNLLLLFVAFTLSLSVAAQTGKMEDKKMEEKKMDKKMDKKKMRDGCMMMDGKMMCKKDGKSMAMDKDMTMKNGTMVMTDGTVKMKNGKTMKMKDGDCIDMDGNMMPHTMESKTSPK